MEESVVFEHTSILWISKVCLVCALEGTTNHTTLGGVCLVLELVEFEFCCSWVSFGLWLSYGFVLGMCTFFCGYTT